MFTSRRERIEARAEREEPAQAYFSYVRRHRSAQPTNRFAQQAGKHALRARRKCASLAARTLKGARRPLLPAFAGNSPLRKAAPAALLALLPEYFRLSC